MIDIPLFDVIVVYTTQVKLLIRGLLLCGQEQMQRDSDMKVTLI